MTFSTDWRVLGFALAVSSLTSLIFGVAPAFGASRVDLTGAPVFEKDCVYIIPLVEELSLRTRRVQPMVRELIAERPV